MIYIIVLAVLILLVFVPTLINKKESSETNIQNKRNGP